MGNALADLYRNDHRIIAITAAMKLGTGLDHFENKCPGRLLDVGIAEEHAATMAAGLAAGGMRPFLAVYASFYQRCYDQMLHDVCMQGLPVVFLLDRSGIGGEDGQTHHGLFDFSISIPVPGLTVLAPSTTGELISMLRWTLTQEGPCVIRYPKSIPEYDHPEENDEFIAGRWRQINENSGICMLAVGSMVPVAADVLKLLKAEGMSATVVNCSSVKPVDEDFLSRIPHDTFLFTMEEHMKAGGFGEYVTRICEDKAFTIPRICFGVDDMYIQHGRHGQLMADAGLDAKSIAEKIKCTVKGDNALG